MNKFSLIFLVLATSFHSNQKTTDQQDSAINPNSLPGKTAYFRQSGSFLVEDITTVVPERKDAPFRFEDYIPEDAFDSFYPVFERNSFSIIIDVTQIARESSSVLDHKYDQSRNQLHKSHRMFIKNLKHRKIVIGDNQRIWCSLEAKDQEGQWRPIEMPRGSGCFGTLAPIELDRNQMAHTLVPIYEGPFETVCRVRMGENYSNAFSASVHPTQFTEYY